MTEPDQAAHAAASAASSEDRSRKNEDRAQEKRARRAVRGWTEQIEAGAESLRIKLRMTRCRTPPSGLADCERDSICDGAERLVEDALRAARGLEPPHRRLLSWWRGTNLEGAFRKLHQAEAELAKLYTDAEVGAEVAAVVARTDLALNRDDPMRAQAHELLQPLPARTSPDHRARAAARRLLLSKMVQVGHEAVDSAHSRLRNLRNVLLSTTACIALLVSVFVLVVAVNPASVPLCFAPAERAGFIACPAGDGIGHDPQAWDVVVVAMLGLLGGSLAAAVSIRNLRGTSTPYDIPIALALLKVPVGALTAIGALIVIRGDFIPGLSALDSQEQVLAYALVFGYAQQLLTGLIDRKALGVLSSVPSKDAKQDRPPLPLPAELPSAGPPPEQPSTPSPRPAPTPGGGPAPPQAEEPQQPVLTGSGSSERAP
ncbi:hypothetical protein ACI8AA_01660 [Geodermatophilus sp. SYSU D01180]